MTICPHQGKAKIVWHEGLVSRTARMTDSDSFRSMIATYNLFDWRILTKARGTRMVNFRWC